MALTDIATFILSIFFLVRGASRGFMKSLLGPFSIIAATILSIIYYKISGDMVASLLIGIIGPWLINLLLKFILKNFFPNPYSVKNPDFLSSVAGSFLTLAWGWVFIIFILILLTVLPPWGETLTTVHNDVAKSISYSFAKRFEDVLFTGSIQSAATITNAVSNIDAKSLAQDPRFQRTLQDPDVQKEIDAHDFGKLMKNPKMIELVQQIMNDPQAMKKVMALYRSQTQAPITKNP